MKEGGEEGGEGGGEGGGGWLNGPSRFFSGFPEIHLFQSNFRAVSEKR